jgi:hypothetical protein
MKRLTARAWSGCCATRARPAFALERLREIDAEHLVYESVKPGPGGSVRVMLTPLELIERLAALMPPPRRHRHRYYGVLAPNAPLCAQVTALACVPESPTAPLVTASESGPPAQPAPDYAGVRMRSAHRLAKAARRRPDRVCQGPLAPRVAAAASSAIAATHGHPRAAILASLSGSVRTRSRRTTAVRAYQSLEHLRKWRRFSFPSACRARLL